MSRDLDGVLRELDILHAEVMARYSGGLSQPEYWKNVGRDNALDEVRERIAKIKRRAGGDDDDAGEIRLAGRGRRGVATDDWGDTPGEVLDESSPF